MTWQRWFWTYVEWVFRLTLLAIFLLGVLVGALVW
jgi:hypothetical protein